MMDGAVVVVGHPERPSRRCRERLDPPRRPSYKDGPLAFSPCRVYILGVRLSHAVDQLNEEQQKGRVTHQTGETMRTKPQLQFFRAVLPQTLPR